LVFFLNIQFNLTFMSNLVIIFLIAIFYFALFLFCWIFSQIHPLIFVWLRILLFYFLDLSLMKLFWSFDPINRSEGLAWVDLYFFKIIFFNIVLPAFFFTFLFIWSPQFHVTCHVFDLLTQVGYRVRLRLFFVIFFLFALINS
jgi:hypothetical protein